MAELKKHDDLLVAIQVNGEVLITEDQGILFEEVGSDSALLYVKTEDGQEVKIKISKKK